jgi:hypothetical protein
LNKRQISSSCSGDVERRPNKGDEDYIKRPENALTFFRRQRCGAGQGCGIGGPSQEAGADRSFQDDQSDDNNEEREEIGSTPSEAIGMLKFRYLSSYI